MYIPAVVINLDALYITDRMLDNTVEDCITNEEQKITRTWIDDLACVNDTPDKQNS